MTRFLDATRERFLLAIAASLPAERFIELHFFPPIRQAGVESGVAVIATHPERVEVPTLADAPLDCHPERSEGSNQNTADPSSLTLLGMTEDDKSPRYTIYTAKYKLVLKGPDRGQWECSVVAEADAPLVTVETVVRGVQRRAGDSDEPERMSGDDARDIVIARSADGAAR